MNGVQESVYVPTGPGEEYVLRADGVELPTHAAWLHDSKRFLFNGTRNGTPVWLIGNLAGGNPKPLSGVAQPAPGSMWLQIAPDADHYSTLDPDGKWWVRHLAGGTPKPIPNLSADDQIVSWTADSKAVFVEGHGSGSARRTDRIDIETGSRTMWREDPDPKGLHETWIQLITPDGKSRAYTFGRGISSLWTAEGLQ
jgi:hypothetical protein